MNLRITALVFLDLTVFAALHGSLVCVQRSEDTERTKKKNPWAAPTANVFTDVGWQEHQKEAGEHC